MIPTCVSRCDEIGIAIRLRFGNAARDVDANHRPETYSRLVLQIAPSLQQVKARHACLASPAPVVLLMFTTEAAALQQPETQWDCGTRDRVVGLAAPAGHRHCMSRIGCRDGRQHSKAGPGRQCRQYPHPAPAAHPALHEKLLPMQKPAFGPSSLQVACAFAPANVQCML